MPKRYHNESGQVLGNKSPVNDSKPMNTTVALIDNRLDGIALEAPETEAHHEEAAPQEPAPRRISLKFILLPIAALALAGAGYFWWDYATTWESTDDATIVGNTHQIAARISGTVSEVLVDDNEYVHAGQPLVRLDDADEQASLASARADLAQNQAEQLQADANVKAAHAFQHDVDTQLATSQALLDQAKSQAVKAASDFKRAQDLVGQGAISMAERDAAQAAHESADAAVRSAIAGVESSHARVETAAAQAHAAEAGLNVSAAKVQNTEAALRSAELQLSYTTITATTDGRVGRKSVQVGNRVVLGQPLMAVVEPATWIVANFKETQLAYMKPGQIVEVEVDALPGRKLTGRLDSFAPASGATFALLPPDNATGNFTKIVQRVPVKITFDPAEVKAIQDRLAPGLSVVTRVNLREPATAPAEHTASLASR
jgi:membrane fusion protein (multidrug efflux system)